jgi:hypothetical protein
MMFTLRALVIVLLSLMPGSVGNAQAVLLQLVVLFDASVTEAVHEPIRAAIRAELNATLLQAPVPGIAVLEIARGTDGQLVLTLRENPQPLTRTLPWSEDSAATARDVAWMTKNLVLDQTQALLGQEPAPAPVVIAAPTPKPAFLDAERPPDYAPKPPPAPITPAPANRPRLVLLAMAMAPVGPIDVNGHGYPTPITAYGVHARFDRPITPNLSAGGGVQLATWQSGDYDYYWPPPDDRTLQVATTIAMDATAWLRAHLPITQRAELYGLFGVGPSTYSLLHVATGAVGERHAIPFLGVNAGMLAGASLLLTRNLGLALELGPRYALAHGDASGGRVTLHTLQLSVQLGALWTFDAR